MAAGGSRLSIPRLGRGEDVYAWADRLVDVVQHALDDVARTASVGITVSNVTPPTTFDASAATAAQSAQALGQLLKALRTAGRIS